MGAADREELSLTQVERDLIAHVERGDLLDLTGDEPEEEEAKRAWVDSRVVRAEVLRDILRGRLAPDPDPRGLRLKGARIVGRVDLDNLTSTVACNLMNCSLSEGITARYSNLVNLITSHCLFGHPTECPVDAIGLTTNDLVFNHATVTAHSTRGAVRLHAARISGVLSCGGATLNNTSGPALNAEWLQTGQSVFLTPGFTAIGSGEVGTVRLQSARIGGQLSLRGATLSNTSGPALNAGMLRTEQDVFLDDGFSATAASDAGAVWLTSARIGGQLSFSGATLKNTSGPAVSAALLKTEQDVFLDGGFSATGDGERAVVDLNGAQTGGELWFDDVVTVTHRTGSQRRLNLDGLVYSGLPRGVSGESWLRLLREGTPTYAAQPYQHLATAHRALGHDREARRVLIQQRRDQIHRRALTGKAERTWARLTGVALGYGYQPWRALLGLLAALTIATVLSVVLGAHGALSRVHTPPDPVPVECTVVERIGVGLDLGTPLVSTGARARCDTARTATGQALTVSGWVLRLLAWAFATLFVAGFTGAVRKT